MPPTDQPAPCSRRAALLRVAGIAMLGAASGVAACSRGAGEPPRAAGPLRIAVTIPPMAGLLRALAPADAQITTLLAPGRSEHGYEFTPSDLGRLARADLVVYVGLNLEPGVEKFLADHPSTRRVNVCFAQAAGVVPYEDHHGGPSRTDEPDRVVGTPHEMHEYAPASGEEPDDDHDHDHEHAHAHGPVDPHVWLDPDLVMHAIPALADGVTRAAAGAGLDPGDLAARQAAVTARLIALDQKHREALAPFAGASIVTHHGAWGRLAARYGLRVAAVVREIEAGEPTPGKIASSVEAIRARHATCVFVEPQFNPDAARRIAQAAGVRLGTIDPLGDGDYFAMMDHNLEQIVAGLSAP